MTKSGYSAFERMMSTFDAFEKTLAKSVRPQPDRVEGLVDQLTSTNEGAHNIGRCVTMFGNDSDKGDTGETYTDQSKKWQDFINGYTQQPQQQVCIRASIYCYNISSNLHFLYNRTSNGRSLSMENWMTSQFSTEML